MGVFESVFLFMSQGVFKAVDANKNGVIEDVEVEVAILSLYNQVNKRLPGWQDPPSRAQIKKALALFDTNKDGVLSEREFNEFAKDLVQAGPDAFFKRTARNYVMTTGVLPAAAFALKAAQKHAPSLLKGMGLDPIANVPPVFLAPLIGATVKAVRGLIPI